MGKHCNNLQCFKEKNYKAKFLISSILKKSNRHRQFQEKKTKKKGKNHVRNTVAIVFCDESYSASPHDLTLFVMTCNCNFQQCFVRKATVISPHD